MKKALLSQRVFPDTGDRRAKDGDGKLAMSERMVGVERVAGRRLHARNRWRLPVLLVGILFAVGRRTVSSWLRAVGVSDDYQDYYYFLVPLGRKAGLVATQLFLLVLRTLPLPDRLLVVIDDSPTKRYGPKVEGADIHRNPTPGPADQKYLYGHIWVTLSLALRHPLWGPLGLPLRACSTCVRRQFNTLRRTALSLLKNNHGEKVGIKNKRPLAALDDDDLQGPLRLPADFPGL